MLMEQIHVDRAHSRAETQTAAPAVIELIEAGEAPIGELPVPGEFTDAALLLLAGALLLSPNKGDEGPIEDRATGLGQDLEFLLSC